VAGKFVLRGWVRGIWVAVVGEEEGEGWFVWSSVSLTFVACNVHIDIIVMSSCNDKSESSMLKKVRVMGFGLHNSDSESEYHFVSLCLYLM
jgi:hypothetical protein